jgi:hypothetical protein
MARPLVPRCRFSLFKLANTLFKMAGRLNLVFEPAENFEEDIRRLWNARPHKYREKLRIRDEDELLRRLIQLELRDLS